MNLIAQFAFRYRKEFDFYEQSCRMAAQILDSHLQSTGVRAIVTSRAKNPARLETKVRQRACEKNYLSVDDIYDDIVDLAGVRVALYFPAEREEVGRIITSIFALVEPAKVFPSGILPSYSKRFSGYWATHYRVRLSEKSLNESQKRYADAKIEIQVASVLMHAWSEVEHDLVYKPVQGQLSVEEYAILDELNGLVLAGEIALERLQRAGELRISAHDREYTSHFDLASSLLDLAREKLTGLNFQESLIGRVDLLFYLLKQLNLNTPEHLSKYVSALHTDFETRPLADQVIDQILAEDAARYHVLDKVRIFDESLVDKETSDAVGLARGSVTSAFISRWIEFEGAIRALAVDSRLGSTGTSSMSLLKLIEATRPDLKETAESLRRFRNQLVHGPKIQDIELIRSHTEELGVLVSRLRHSLDPKPSTARRPVKRSASHTRRPRA